MPTLCEYLSLECRQANHFFGVPGYTVGLSLFGFSRADFSLIDFVLTSRPSLTHITEIGTGGGLVSLFLGVSASIRGGALHSFDVRDCRGEGIKRAWLTEHTFSIVDVFDGPEGTHPAVVKSISREHNLILFDGGSKMLEIARFRSHISKNSVFLIHDWEDESFEAGFERALDDLGFDRGYWDMSELLGSHLRVYVPV